MAKGSVHFPTALLSMEIKSNQSEPVTTAAQSKRDWVDGLGKDTTERGSSKCFILIFSLVALFVFYVVPLFFQVCSESWRLPGDVQPAVMGMQVSSL